jgi:hypothetical protein
VACALFILSYSEAATEKPVPKKKCLELAKQKIEKTFKMKVQLGNDSGGGPWSFLYDRDGCTYVVTISNLGGKNSCKLSNPEKSEQPSRCEGE